MGLFSSIKGKVKPLMQLDTSLTKSGQAADAKAVGDKFNNTLNDISNVDNKVISLTNAVDKVSKDVYRTNEGLPGYWGDGVYPRTIELENKGNIILNIANKDFGNFMMFSSGGIRHTSTEIETIHYISANYWKGVLTINSSDTHLNDEGQYYEYQVL